MLLSRRRCPSRYLRARWADQGPLLFFSHDDVGLLFRYIYAVGPLSVAAVVGRTEVCADDVLKRRRTPSKGWGATLVQGKYLDRYNV